MLGYFFNIFLINNHQYLLDKLAFTSNKPLDTTKSELNFLIFLYYEFPKN